MSFCKSTFHGQGADQDDKAGVEEGAVRGALLTVLVKIRERRCREGAPRHEARAGDAQRLGERAQGLGCGVCVCVCVKEREGVCVRERECVCV